MILDKKAVLLEIINYKKNMRIANTEHRNFSTIENSYQDEHCFLLFFFSFVDQKRGGSLLIQHLLNSTQREFNSTQ